MSMPAYAVYYIEGGERMGREEKRDTPSQKMIYPRRGMGLGVKSYEPLEFTGRSFREKRRD